MTYPEILAAVLAVLGVFLAAGAALVVWDGRRDDHGTPRRPRPPGGRGTWARRRAHWVARCQAQAIRARARVQVWGIRATAAVRVWGFRARGKGWQWRARRTTRRRAPDALDVQLLGHRFDEWPPEEPEPSRLATAGERSDAGLPTREEAS